ncbi:MAG: TolB family protein [Actinomycetota bacterium]
MGSGISADGRYLVFMSAASNLVGNDTNGSYDVFVFDTEDLSIEMVSVDENGGPSNSHSMAPGISPDGNYVAFTSYATDLVGDDENNQGDVFLRDLASDETTRISLNEHGHYVDTNVTFFFVNGGTYVDECGERHWYLGLGFGLPGVSVTYSNSHVSCESSSFQGSYGVAGSVGGGIPPEGSAGDEQLYGEVGVGTPGAGWFHNWTSCC